MKLSDFIKLVQIASESTPSEMSVNFGCDCGCGGDFYTSEAWDKEHDEIEDARIKVLEEIQKLNSIENDKGW